MKGYQKYMHRINENVVFVQGAIKGALYDFITGRVFWINENSCAVINKLTTTLKPIFTYEEQEYIDELVKENLFDKNYIVKPYIPEVTELTTLEMAWLEVTQTCNCKCLHCYQGEEHKSAKILLDIEDWKNIIAKLKKLEVKRVVVIGGEPCTYKHIDQILKCLCENKIKTTLFTNGTLFSDSLKKLIVQNKDNIKIKVSLYGDDCHSHDQITRVNGSFKTLDSTIKYFKKNNVDVDIAVVVMKENQDIVDKIEKYITDLDIKYNGYDVIRNVFGGTQDQHTPDNTDIISSSTFLKPEFFASLKRFTNNTHKNSCWFGKLAITETGDVLPCVFERNIIYGNTKNVSLENILTSHALKKNWFYDFSQVDFCKDCEFRFACRDCRPLAMATAGRKTDKNPRCTYNPYTGEWRNNNE